MPRNLQAVKRFLPKLFRPILMTRLASPAPLKIVTLTSSLTGLHSLHPTLSVTWKCSEAEPGSTSSSAPPVPIRNRSTNYLITESTPLANPHWDYSRNKIACEERLLKAYREEGFPATIVRPSLTYGENLVPLVINSWERSYTVVDRMFRGQKVIVPGDGSSLWVITHNSDFAKGFIGLFGQEQAIGHAFHITTDEVLTWDQLYRTVAAAAGVEARIVHIPSDFMVACLPEMEGTLTGDKSVSVVFDNTKIKRFVPDYVATTTFAQGIRQSLAWFDADPGAS